MTKVIVSDKRDFTKRNNKGYKDFTIGLNPSSLSWLAKITKLRKGLIIIVWLWRHLTIGLEIDSLFKYI